MLPYFHMSNAYFCDRALKVILELMFDSGFRRLLKLSWKSWSLHELNKRLRDCGDNMLRHSDAVLRLLRQACRLRVCQQMFDLKKAETRESESVIGSCPPASFYTDVVDLKNN